jgi:uncharacterized protein (DUF58 family)
VAFDHPYLDLSRMEMLRHVRLRPRGMAEGAFAGPHKSPYRGTAVEFADYRSYSDGDDIRLVDWKVFARTDKHYLRLYDAERDLLSYVVLDTSGSMAFEGVVQKTDAKIVYGCKLAAALAYLVVDTGDEVGLTMASDVSNGHLAAHGGFAHLSAIITALAAAKAAGKAELGSCLLDVYRRAARRGVLIIISDFLASSDDYWQRIDLFRKSRFDVILFHVVHPEEIELPRVSMARFLDTEGGDLAFLTEPDEVRARYRERFQAHLRNVEAMAQRRGCDWYLCRTDEDPYRLLQRCFLARDVGVAR